VGVQDGARFGFKSLLFLNEGSDFGSVVTTKIILVLLRFTNKAFLCHFSLALLDLLNSCIDIALIRVINW
jgi:hypothetical protein